MCRHQSTRSDYLPALLLWREVPRGNGGHRIDMKCEVLFGIIGEAIPQAERARNGKSEFHGPQACVAA